MDAYGLRKINTADLANAVGAQRYRQSVESSSGVQQKIAEALNAAGMTILPLPVGYAHNDIRQPRPLIYEDLHQFDAGDGLYIVDVKSPIVQVLLGFALGRQQPEKSPHDQAVITTAGIDLLVAQNSLTDLLTPLNHWQAERG